MKLGGGITDYLRSKEGTWRERSQIYVPQLTASHVLSCYSSIALEKMEKMIPSEMFIHVRP